MTTTTSSEQDQAAIARLVVEAVRELLAGESKTRTESFLDLAAAHQRAKTTTVLEWLVARMP